MGRPLPLRAAEPLATGWLLVGLVAIPLLSVSAAARLVDVVAQANPLESLTAMVGLLGGAITGLLVHRLVAGVGAGVRVMVWALGSEVGVPGGWLTARWQTIGGGGQPAAVPSPVFVPAGTGRRGPPFWAG